MSIELLESNNVLWKKVIAFARDCSWKAGPYLAKHMEENGFSDWERVLVALENDTIAGYCTLAKKDCIPNVAYSPYIGYVFVGEQYRGKRLSEKMIVTAMAYAKELGFNTVYLVSDHINLYEKYGFIQIDEKEDYRGNTEKIYMHLL